MRRPWFASDVWLPEGWARNVRCEVDAQGRIVRIDADANADGCERTVGLCPTTEANLGDGFFALREYLSHGGVFGIGSDSNISTSCAEELRWLEYGQRLKLRQRNVVRPTGERSGGHSGGETLYRQALHGGAQASGRPVNGLVAGQRADLVVLDANHSSLIGCDRDSWLDAYVFCAAGNPVRDVMVGGKWVIRDGRHALEEGIATRYAGALRELTS